MFDCIDSPATVAVSPTAHENELLSVSVVHARGCQMHRGKSITSSLLKATLHVPTVNVDFVSHVGPDTEAGAMPQGKGCNLPAGPLPPAPAPL